MRKAAFLDRDGVINKDKAYVYRWEDFEFVPGAIDAMRQIQAEGYALVVVTNQSGIARGFFTEAQYEDLTQKMCAELARQGVRLDGVYHCPHHAQGSVLHLAIECACRKPAPGMLLRAAQELNLSLPNSLLIGDKDSDIKAARVAGVGKAFFMSPDKCETSEQYAIAAGADACFANLVDCVQALFKSAT